jgi:hypothetical protein
MLTGAPSLLVAVTTLYNHTCNTLSSPLPRPAPHTGPRGSAQGAAGGNGPDWSDGRSGSSIAEAAPVGAARVKVEDRGRERRDRRGKDADDHPHDRPLGSGTLGPSRPANTVRDARDASADASRPPSAALANGRPARRLRGPPPLAHAPRHTPAPVLLHAHAKALGNDVRPALKGRPDMRLLKQEVGDRV